MKHTVEAYDALVDKLKVEIGELHEAGDRRSDQNVEVNDILLTYLVKHGGVDAALAAAREIDKQFDIGFVFMVDLKYVED